MKKAFKYLVLVLVVSLVFTVTGCDNNPRNRFENPKDVTISKNGAKITFSYDDDGKYDVNKVDKSETIISNSNKKFRIDFMYGHESTSEQKKTMGYFKKDKNYVVLDDIEFNGYKGYVCISKSYGTADVYLYIDEPKNVVANVRISTTKTSEVEKELKKKKPEDVLYNKEDVQNILKTVTYNK